MAAVDFDRYRTGLWVATAVVLATLVYVGWRYIGTLVLGLFVYYVTRPVFERIHTRIRSRTLAVVVSLFTVALPVLVVVGWTLAVAFRALANVFMAGSDNPLVELVGPYVDVSVVVPQVNAFVRRVLDDPSRLRSLDLAPVFSGTADVVLVSLGGLFTALLHGFVTLVIVFYLLRDDYRLVRWARGTFVTRDGVLESYFVAVDRDLSNVYFGNILNALVTGLIGAITYVILDTFAPEVVRIPEPVLVGLLAGVASLVPVIGIKLVTVPVALYLFARALLVSPRTLWFPVVFTVVSFVVVDYIPDQLLRPYVSGRTLHVGAIMVAYVIGPLLFGWYGIFLGPLVLVVLFEFGRIIFPAFVARERSSRAVSSALDAPDSAVDVDAPGSAPDTSDSRSEERVEPPAAAVDLPPDVTQTDRRPSTVDDDGSPTE